MIPILDPAGMEMKFVMTPPIPDPVNMEMKVRMMFPIPDPGVRMVMKTQ